MKLTLHTILSTDLLQLPGLLYTPENDTKRAAIWLHGMGDSGTFYNPPRINALGEALTGRGISLLAFNNRGAHTNKSLRRADPGLPEDKQRLQAGTHFEKIIDCVKDIDGAASFLKQKGYEELYLIGHSSGANKVCVYDAHANTSAFSKYVLAGPGDDTGLHYKELGIGKCQRTLSYAQQAVANGQPLKILPAYTGMHPFSAQSALDILNPDGDYNTFPLYEMTTKRLGEKPLFAEYSQMYIPTLVVYGENDDYTYVGGGTAATLEIFKSFANKTMRPSAAFEVIAEADHGFHGQETAFAERVASWLAS